MAPKTKGPICWGAVIPFVSFVALIAIYSHFFMDHHLRLALQWGLTKAAGAEVDIGDVETSFWNAHMRIAKIEITDADTPANDSVSIGEIRYGMLWDALLRAKIVINEAVVEQIEFGKPRAKPGWVKPPAPPAPVATGPSATDKLKNEAASELATEQSGNLFGDLGAMLGGSTAQGQLDQLTANLPSKKMAADIQAEVDTKKRAWTDRIKTLPQAAEFQALGDKLKKVKTKDFKSPQEVQASLQQINDIYKEGDGKIKAVQAAGNDLGTDLNKINGDVKALQAQIQTDVKTLETHFKIPSLDPKEITMALLHKHLGKYLAKFERYRALAEKYVPPNVLKKGDKKPDPSLQPRLRAKGITYEFGRPHSYPLFWTKRVAISSKAGASPYAGDIRGEILDITSNQVLTEKPTVAHAEGDFPGMNIRGFTSHVTIDNREAESLIDAEMGVKSFPLQAEQLVQSDAVKIGFQKATGGINVKSSLRGLKILDLRLENQFNDIAYEISATNDVLDQLLKKVFAGVPVVTMDAHLSGTLPQINTDLESNLGPELQKGFSREISAKIAETKAKIDKAVNDAVGKQRAQIEAQIAQLRAQVEGPIKKVQAQADAEKKQVDAKTDQAKNAATGSIKEEATKAVDDLKKKFGF